MQNIEESWAEKFSLGPVDITSVPVSESAFGNRYNTILGMAALARLYLFIDGKNGWVYLQPVRIPPYPFQHDRLGANFAPRNSKNDDLFAKVAKNSPAHEAGIRDGDILLKINGHDETHWRTDTNPPPIIRPFDLPAGTQIELTLKRGKQIFNVTPTLRNIIPPDAPK